MMYRENVLIALTILVTILCLSYIILMTVFMQLHDIERRLQIHKKYLEQQQEEKQKSDIEAESYLRHMQIQQETIDKERAQNALENPWSAPAAPYEYPQFGFNEDRSPPDAIKFPFYFYGGDGHASIVVPRPRATNQTTNFDQDIDILRLVVSKVHERMMSFFQQQAEKDRFRRDSKVLDGYVWFQADYLKNISSPHGSSTAASEIEPWEEEDYVNEDITPMMSTNDNKSKRVKRSFTMVRRSTGAGNSHGRNRRRYYRQRRKPGAIRKPTTFVPSHYEIVIK